MALEVAASGQSLRSAIAALSKDLHAQLGHAVDLMLTAGMGVPGDDLDGDAQSPPGSRTRLGGDLRSLLDQDEMLEALGRALLEVAEPDQQRYDAWLQRQFIDSAASALLSALWGLLPEQAGAAALEIDVIHSPEPHVWITESTLGGGGTIEAIGAAFGRDPWKFARAFDAALAPSDSEVIASALSRIADLLINNSSASDAAVELRAAASHTDRDRAQKQFNRTLAAAGVPVDRALSVAIAQRLMRPGAGRALDELVARLDRRRDEIDRVLNFSLDLRLMTLVLATDNAASKDVEAVLGLRGSRPSIAQSAATLAGVLWPTSAEYRRHALGLWSPYWAATTPDPGALRASTAASIVRVSVLDDSLHDRATAD